MTTDEGSLSPPPDPSAALRRVIAAIGGGRDDLDPADLHAISGSALDDGLVRTEFDQLDPSARFAVLDQLRDTAMGPGGYDFTSLFAVALHDDDLPVRALAAGALAVGESPSATAALLESAASSEEDDEVRREAVTALGAIALRLELGWASGEGAETVVETLRVIAQDPREDETVRGAAVAAVGVISEQWVSGLIDDAFYSDSAALHLGAVQAMGRSADLAWLPLLEGSITAEDTDERIAAAQAVGEIGSEDGVPLLVDLFDDPTAEVELIRAAIAALGEIGGGEAVEELERLRTHPTSTVRVAAQEALDAASWLDQSTPDDDAEAAFGFDERW